MNQSYFHRKTIAELSQSRPTPGRDGRGFARSLGPFSLMALGVGAIIGAGIFVLTGAAAARYAGPAIVLSFTLAGSACAIVALCYADRRLHPRLRQHLFLCLRDARRDFRLDHRMGPGPGIRHGRGDGGGGLVRLFRRGWPKASPPPLAGLQAIALAGAPKRVFNVPAAAIVLMITALLTLGTRESARVQQCDGGFKLAVVVTVIVVGGLHVVAGQLVALPARQHRRIRPFRPEWRVSRRGGGVFRLYRLRRGIDGLAGGAPAPGDVPIGLIGALTICTLLYIAVAAVITGVVPYLRLERPTPSPSPSTPSALPSLALVVKFAALAGLTTVILVLLYGQSRIFFAIATDGFVP